MTATKQSFSLIDLDEAGPGAAERGFGLGTEPGRGRVYLRRELGISSFGVNAFFQANAGSAVIGEHDELGPAAGGHEELYLVVSGSATFTVDGETVVAPRGTALFVGSTASKRKAVADEDGTTVVVVGGTPGEAFELSPGEAMGDFYRRYRAKDYAGALEQCRAGLEIRPGNAVILYNVACMESLLGHADAAIEALTESVAGWADYKELAAGDDDFASLRDDPRFQQLIA